MKLCAKDDPKSPDYLPARSYTHQTIGPFTNRLCIYRTPQILISITREAVLCVDVYYHSVLAKHDIVCSEAGETWRLCPDGGLYVRIRIFCRVS